MKQSGTTQPRFGRGIARAASLVLALPFVSSFLTPVFAQSAHPGPYVEQLVGELYEYCWPDSEMFRVPEEELPLLSVTVAEVEPEFRGIYAAGVRSIRI